MSWSRDLARHEGGHALVAALGGQCNVITISEGRDEHGWFCETRPMSIDPNAPGGPSVTIVNSFEITLAGPVFSVMGGPGLAHLTPAERLEVAPVADRAFAAIYPDDADDIAAMDPGPLDRLRAGMFAGLLALWIGEDMADAIWEAGNLSLNVNPRLLRDALGDQVREIRRLAAEPGLLRDAGSREALCAHIAEMPVPPIPDGAVRPQRRAA